MIGVTKTHIHSSATAAGSTPARVGALAAVIRVWRAEVATARRPGRQGAGDTWGNPDLTQRPAQLK